MSRHQRWSGRPPQQPGCGTSPIVGSTKKEVGVEQSGGSFSWFLLQQAMSSLLFPLQATLDALRSVTGAGVRVCVRGGNANETASLRLCHAMVTVTTPTVDERGYKGVGGCSSVLPLSLFCTPLLSSVSSSVKTLSSSL